MATGGPGEPQRSFGPTRHDLKSNEGFEDWVGVETDQASQEREKSFPKELKAVFGYRTVKEIPPEETEKIAGISGHLSESAGKIFR